jgi:hypothetical protein
MLARNRHGVTTPPQRKRQFGRARWLGQCDAQHILLRTHYAHHHAAVVDQYIAHRKMRVVRQRELRF